LPSLGSVGGIRAVVAGAINFSISGRVPTDEELANGLSTVAYATTALAFVAALDGDHDSLTTEDLIDIYSGTMLTWQDGEAIRLVLRPETDTDTILIKNKIPELAESLAAAAARRGVQIETSDQHAADRLEHMPEGLGFVSLSLVISENRALKVLELDGVLPSTETIENGTYPLVKTFHFVSRQDRSPAEQSFLDFLHSPVVLEILANTGHGLVGHGA